MSQPQGTKPVTTANAASTMTCASCGNNVPATIRKLGGCKVCNKLFCAQHMQLAGICKDCYAPMLQARKDAITRSRKTALLASLPGLVILVIGMVLMINNLMNPV
jgi:hypothetical protein